MSLPHERSDCDELGGREEELILPALHTSSLVSSADGSRSASTAAQGQVQVA